MKHFEPFVKNCARRAWALCLIFAAVTNTSPLYIMSIQTPAISGMSESVKYGIDHLLTGYCNGYEVSFHDGCAALPGFGDKQVFSLVISDRFCISGEEDGNGVRCLERIPGRPCLWYDITIRRIKGSFDADTLGRCKFQIRRRTLNEVPLQIPPFGIKILLPPSWVAGVRDLEVLGSDSAIYLPAIVLKSDLDPAEMEQQLLDIWMHKIDISAVHKKKMEKCRLNGTCKPQYQSGSVFESEPALAPRMAPMPQYPQSPMHPSNQQFAQPRPQMMQVRPQQQIMQARPAGIQLP